MTRHDHGLTGQPPRCDLRVHRLVNDGPALAPADQLIDLLGLPRIPGPETDLFVGSDGERGAQDVG